MHQKGRNRKYNQNYWIKIIRLAAPRLHENNTNMDAQNFKVRTNLPKNIKQPLWRPLTTFYTHRKFGSWTAPYPSKACGFKRISNVSNKYNHDRSLGKPVHILTAPRLSLIFLLGWDAEKKWTITTVLQISGIFIPYRWLLRRKPQLRCYCPILAEGRSEQGPFLVRKNSQQ